MGTRGCVGANMAALIGAMRFRFVSLESRAALAVKVSPDVVKRYVRALRRRPVKVLYPEEDSGKVVSPKPTKGAVGAQHPERPVCESRKKSAASGPKTNTAGEAHKSSTSMVRRDRSEHKVKTEAKDYGRFSDFLGGLRYEKVHAGDKRLAKAVSAARSRKYREQQGRVLLEGQRLITDALLAGAVPQTLFFSRVEDLRELPLHKLRHAALLKVKLEDIRTWSDLVTPQGVIAIFSRPDASRLAFPEGRCSHTVPLHLVCDNVRDPGNLGTILRCAAAAGCQTVLLTKGCVDAWDLKVLRSAMGAHFRLPIIPSLDWGDVPRHLPAGVTLHVADTCSASSGHQGAAGEVEQHKCEASTKAVDYGWVRSRSSTGDAALADWDSDSEDDEEVEGGLRVSLPVVKAQVYHEDWVKQHTALVIGGETHGLSLEALQLAQHTDGRRLFVPMVPGVNSLNSAMAASVLMFEARRQLVQRHQG